MPQRDDELPEGTDHIINGAMETGGGDTGGIGGGGSDSGPTGGGGSSSGFIGAWHSSPQNETDSVYSYAR